MGSLMQDEMKAAAARKFDDVEAKRGQVPLLVGLVGPSGGGKTYSALRLATGIQRVTGGDIFMIDTEARRGLHYADTFRFRHQPFAPPFGPLHYLAAVEHCVKRGARVIVIDSMSHEHEGPGGVLEMHAAERTRLAEAWRCSESKTDMTAWSDPKAQRRRMINSLLQLPISVIFCFRAKEKLKVQPGRDPQPRGYMAIAGEELVFEMTMNALLLPRANGVPTWESEYEGELATMKLPRDFVGLFPTGNEQLTETIGESIANWAEGFSAAPARNTVGTVAGSLLALVRDPESTDEEIVKAIESAKDRKQITKTELVAIRSAFKERQDSRPKAAPESDPGPPDEIEQPYQRQPGDES